MRKIGLFFLCLTLAHTFCNAQVIKTKVIDNGSSGYYKSVAVTDSSLPDFVIYRPQNIIEAVEKEGKLPILVWANGGCMNSSIHHERLLSEVASHGYMVIAIGKLQMTVDERVHNSTSEDELLKALDWICEQEKTHGSDFYQNVDLNKIAAGGQSCGGAQTFRVADDNRIRTYLIFNAGMGNMTMAGANSKSLEKLHGKIIYIIGGKSDIAYENAILDYERINTVPVVFANHETAGHGGTFAEEFGGSFARMALDWLDWQFKNKDHSAVFLTNNLTNYPGWSIKSKGFHAQVESSSYLEFSKPQLEFVCELKVTIAPPLNIGSTPHGERIIIPITGGTFKGPRMKGVILSGGADYQYFNKTLGRTELEAIYTIQTDDDVLIHVRNIGLLCKTNDVNSGHSSGYYFGTTPKFEAPVNSQYAWLNNAVFVCKPVEKEGYISIQVWKLL